MSPTDTETESRSARKHRAMMEAATAVFIAKGYDGASMEEIATRAGVSKQTLYKHFADKDRLFEEIVLSTTGRVDAVVALVAETLGDAGDLGSELRNLAGRLLSTLMAPELLRLRRLVIANAERAPKLGRSWYAQGFGRVLETLAASFAALSANGQLRAPDPRLAATHFVGMLLWIPVNEAMFTGETRPMSAAELDRLADGAVAAFLAGYGSGR
jgi:TetR/AcrR family transcriptional regulator, mexJK operon transcriptional repressor